MYIYTIKNLINGKIYVGQTVQSNPKMRWYSHQADARNGKKTHLYDSFRKHGVENFLWEIVDYANDIERLNELETQWANKLRDQGIILYNNRETGGNKKHSAESIEKMKEAQRIAHAKRREANGGIEKHSQHKPHRTGWKNSAQAKINKKMAIRKYWDNLTTPRKLTEEHKRKVSESGKRVWDERKLKQNGGTQN